MALRPDGFGLLPIREVEPQLLAAFSCGKARLDQFLVEQATDLHLDRLGHTTVVFHQDLNGIVVGYFTLSNDGIPLKTSEITELGLRGEAKFTAFPAVKLGRLAVHQDLQGQGIGRQLVDLVLGEILDSESLSAARLLIVDADNDPSVLTFYRKEGFQLSLWAENATRNHARGERNAQPATVKMIRDVLRETLPTKLDAA